MWDLAIGMYYVGSSCILVSVEIYINIFLPLTIQISFIANNISKWSYPRNCAPDYSLQNLTVKSTKHITTSNLNVSYCLYGIVQ